MPWRMFPAWGHRDMDTFQLMLERFEHEGKGDMSAAKVAYAKHLATTKATPAQQPGPPKYEPLARKPEPVLITLDLNETAAAIDEAIAASIAPLEQRLSDLEAEVAALRDKAAPTLRRVV